MSPFGPLRRTGPTDKFLARMAVACAVLILACGGLTLGLLGTMRASRAESAVQGSCQFFRDLTALPVTAKSTEPLLRIVADARVAYVTGECRSTKGPLGPPDPRVVPFLPNGFR